jgi:hypothetical protein
MRIVEGDDVVVDFPRLCFFFLTFDVPDFDVSPSWCARALLPVPSTFGPISTNSILILEQTHKAHQSP